MSAYTDGLVARFWAKVAKGSPKECWPWQGYTVPSGHGQTSYQSYPIPAHRKAWILTHGPIRDGLCANHRCDNPACCNPSHLYLGTRADNMIDRWAPHSKRGQRPYTTVLPPEKIEELYQLRRGGMKLKDCAARFGVHIATVVRYINMQRRIKLEKIRADRRARIAHPSI
jgi:hypothetical protein